MTDNNQEEPNPIEELASFMLQVAQNSYTHLSPMSHVIAFSLAISHIAHAIDVSAQEIASQTMTSDFMQKAAADAGMPPTPTVRSLDWDMNHNPPGCPYCAEGTMLYVDKIILGELVAKSHCINCQTKFYLNLIGETI